MSCPSCKNISIPKEDARAGDHTQQSRHSNSLDQIPVSGNPDEAETNSSIPLVENYMDSSSHLLHHCPTFRNIALQKNFENDKDIIDFYRAVIDYRIEHNEDI